MGDNLKGDQFHAMYLSDGWAVNFTAAAAFTAGDVVDLGGGLHGIVKEDVALAAQGSAYVRGIVRGRKVTGTITVGDLVGWDTTGTPLGWSTATGAFTNVPSAMEYTMGTCAATTTGNTVDILLAPAVSNLDGRLLMGNSTTLRRTFTDAVDVVQFFTNCTATTGICTGLDFEHAAGYQGSTALQFTGVRGVLRVLSGTTHTAGYNDASAGYILMAGTINGTGHYYGVRGVVMDGGTWTACTEVSAACFEYNNSQTVSSGSTNIVQLKNNSIGAVQNGIYVYNGQEITSFLNFSHATAPVTVGSDSTNVTHKIAIKIGNDTRYLHVFSD
jgi:hypothetical protein